MKTVFVTGATGVLGKRVVKLLVQKGISVIALSRSDRNDSFIKEMGATPQRGDLFNPEDMTDCSQGCEAIFHLATSIPKVAIPNKPSYWAMNDRIRTEGTRSLLQAAETNNINCYIQPSVTLLYGNKHGAVVDDDTPIDDSPAFMLHSAVDMEKMIREASRVDFSILRFGSFYSADSSSTVGMIASIRQRKLPIVGNGEYYWNNIHVDDAARAVLYVFENFDRLRNKTVNFTDFSPVKFKVMVGELVKMTNSKKPFHIPSFIARLMLGRSLFRVFTGSFQIQKSELIQDWKPKYENFIMGVKEMDILPNLSQ